MHVVVGGAARGARLLARAAFQAREGLALEVRGSIEARATTAALPFDDPDKKKRTAIG